MTLHNGSFRLNRPLEVLVEQNKPGHNPVEAFIYRYLRNSIPLIKHVHGSPGRVDQYFSILVSCLNPRENVVLSFLSRKSIDTFFNNELAVEQGYILEISEKNIHILGAASVGILYGFVSLNQIFTHFSAQGAIPCMSIMDRPDFRYRTASRWQIVAEIAGWSYDRGDGLAKYKRRIKTKLDFCLAHKINCVRFDGFSWNKERFPGYSRLMREFNEYAGERGIHLNFGGWIEGFKTVLHTPEADRAVIGKRFENRYPYPGGKLYHCRVEPYRFVKDKNTAATGTCLANKNLGRDKLEYLREFTKAVRPGSLYIHPIDVATFDAARKSWKLRCIMCRKRWPSDKIDSDTGMAGAISWWYDKIVETINNVTSSDGSYDASRDCIIRLVCPLYSAYKEGFGEGKSEEIWKKVLNYYAEIGRLFKPRRNVEFLFREQFRSYDGKRTRFEEVKDIFFPHRIECVSVGGGDLYFNDYLVVGTSSMNKIFKGADSIFNFCGGSNQEPLQVINAEFDWNFNSPYALKIPTDFRKAHSLFERLRNGKLIPKKLFKRNGFLHIVCNRLYGEESGCYVAGINTLRTKSGVGPLWIPHPYFRGVKGFDKTFGDSDRGVPFWKEKYNITKLAETLAEKALKAADRKTENYEDLKWLLKSFQVGKQLCKMVIASSGSDRERSGKARKELISFLGAHIAGNTIDPFGGYFCKLR